MDWGIWIIFAVINFGAMASLYLRNIGPVKEINIVLNRINVFIGPQSSGKSTIAKIVSFCNWLEKDCVLEQDVTFINWAFIADKLVNYHNLQACFSEESVIRYEGNLIRLEVIGQDVKAEIVNPLEQAFLTKNAYIPSERNMLALPGIFSIKMPQNYLLEFIDDWQELRSKYSAEDKFSILNLGDSYFYNDSENADKVCLADGKEIRFSQASSGLQSVIPLCVSIDYLTRWIYEHEENRSASDRKKFREVVMSQSEQRIQALYTDKFGEKEALEMLKQFVSLNESERQEYLVKLFDSGKEVGNEYHLPREAMFMMLTQSLPYMIKMQLAFPVSTNLVIEEPEQNLFPMTQVNLVYYIFSKVDHKHRPDTLVITTHSPYILYALNNCLLAGLAVKSNSEIENMVDEFSNVPKDARIDPEVVTVWELENGYIKGNKTIQDERGLIRGNYFDDVMKNVMADFHNLVNFIN